MEYLISFLEIQIRRSQIVEIPAIWQLSYGMYAIGVSDGGRMSGCIANTVFQITAEPEAVALSMNLKNYTHGLIAKNGLFTVSILAEDVPRIVVASLGFSSGRDKDKFNNLPYALLPSGLPYITEGCCGVLECRVHSSLDCGTHTVYVGRVESSQPGSAGTPMTYAYYHQVFKGRAPENAPTYRPKIVSE